MPHSRTTHYRINVMLLCLVWYLTMGNSPCFALKVLYHSDVNLYIAFSLLHGNNGLLSIKFLRVTLWHMSICAGVVVAVTFQQVDNAPDTETGTERDNEGLKNGDCLFKKCHIVC